MSRHSDEASIVLLTWNGEKYLDQVLEMIHRQRCQPVEVLAIDSNSTDSTPEILRKFQISTTTIPQNEFSHPATRNMAASLCSGKYVVFLTQDAVPADSCWLECLLRPFHEMENVAGVFSRQIPRPGASLLEANDLRLDFPIEGHIKKLAPGETLDSDQLWKLIKFSNSSSAYNRELLLQHPFEERLEMAEDQEWVKRMLVQNFAFVYQPSSTVIHSHEHSLKEKYSRSFSMGKSFSSFLNPLLGRLSSTSTFGAWAGHVYLDFRYILSADAPIRNKCKWAALSPVHRAIIHHAYRQGWNSVLRQAERSIKKPQTVF
jgi:rhamnosyltransferase